MRAQCNQWRENSGAVVVHVAGVSSGCAGPPATSYGAADNWNMAGGGGWFVGLQILLFDIFCPSALHACVAKCSRPCLHRIQAEASAMHLVQGRKLSHSVLRRRCHFFCFCYCFLHGRASFQVWWPVEVVFFFFLVSVTCSSCSMCKRLLSVWGSSWTTCVSRNARLSDHFSVCICLFV